MVAYGRASYRVGRPYNHFAETINALSARKPNLRRHLQVALQQEPSGHDVAMPPPAGALGFSFSGVDVGMGESGWMCFFGVWWPFESWRSDFGLLGSTAAFR